MAQDYSKSCICGGINLDCARCLGAGIVVVKPETKSMPGNKCPSAKSKVVLKRFDTSSSASEIQDLLGREYIKVEHNQKDKDQKLDRKSLKPKKRLSQRRKITATIKPVRTRKKRKRSSNQHQRNSKRANL